MLNVLLAGLITLPAKLTFASITLFKSGKLTFALSPI
jgi:hypothetical protein